MHSRMHCSVISSTPCTLVPDCSAHPFCINASIVYVSSAPANRSEGDFLPLTVGIANMSYTRKEKKVRKERWEGRREDRRSRAQKWGRTEGSEGGMKDSKEERRKGGKKEGR
jgi:hypothetical protein